MAKAHAKKAAAPKAAARIVEGAGVAVVTDDAERGQRIEKAMADAIRKAMDEGVSDPAEQRKRMMAARDEAMKGS